MTNDSNYALLAGPPNVFLDNNFLTKVRITLSFFYHGIIIQVAYAFPARKLRVSMVE